MTHLVDANDLTASDIAADVAMLVNDQTVDNITFTAESNGDRVTVTLDDGSGALRSFQLRAQDSPS